MNGSQQARDRMRKESWELDGSQQARDRGVRALVAGR